MRIQKRDGKFNLLSLFFGILEKAVIFYFTPGLSSYPAVKIAAKNVKATPTIITVPML
jgi:hypothetical protein